MIAVPGRVQVMAMPELRPLMPTQVMSDGTSEDMMMFFDVVYEKGYREWVGSGGIECFEMLVVEGRES